MIWELNSCVKKFHWGFRGKNSAQVPVGFSRNCRILIVILRSYSGSHILHGPVRSPYRTLHAFRSYRILNPIGAYPES